MVRLPADIGRHLKRRIYPHEVKVRRLRLLKKRYRLTFRDIGLVIERHPATVKKYHAGRLEIPISVLEYAEHYLRAKS